MKSKVKYDHHARLLVSFTQLEIDNLIRSKKKAETDSHQWKKN